MKRLLPILLRKVLLTVAFLLCAALPARAQTITMPNSGSNIANATSSTTFTCTLSGTQTAGNLLQINWVLINSLRPYASVSDSVNGSWGSALDYEGDVRSRRTGSASYKMAAGGAAKYIVMRFTGTLP